MRSTYNVSTENKRKLQHKIVSLKTWKLIYKLLFISEISKQCINSSKILYHKSNNFLFKNKAKICIKLCLKLQMLSTLATNFETYSCSKSPTVNFFLIPNIKKPISLKIKLFANFQFINLQ